MTSGMGGRVAYGPRGGRVKSPIHRSYFWLVRRGGGGGRAPPPPGRGPPGRGPRLPQPPGWRAARPTRSHFPSDRTSSVTSFFPLFTLTRSGVVSAFAYAAGTQSLRSFGCP
jgi:hypothetical protein